MRRRVAGAADHRLRAAGAAPARHVGGGADRTRSRLAVPDRDLLDLGRQMAGAQDRQSHRQLAAIGKERVVAEIAVLDGETHGAVLLGSSKALLETLDPARAGRPDRDVDKLRPVEGQHDLQAGAVPQQCLGKQDVGPGRQRAIAEPDLRPGDPRLDFGGDRGFLVGRKAAVLVAGCGNDVAEIVDHPRRRQSREPGCVEPVRIGDEPQLPHRARPRPQADRLRAGIHAADDRHAGAGLADAAEDEQCLDFGRGLVIAAAFRRP